MIKTIYSISRVVLVTALVFASVLTANAAKGDFGAWDLTEVGNDGLTTGKIDFTERNMTLEAWLYIDETEGKNLTGVNVISNRHNGHQGFSVNLRKNSATSNEDLAFVFKNSKYDTTNGETYDQAFTIFLPRAEFSEKWGHLAFVISSEEHKAYAYLNGELYDVLEDFYTDWIGNRTSDELWLGRWYPKDPQFHGKMADVRVWNVERSSEEIAENYNKRLTGTEEGLYVYYNFDNFDQVITNVANPGTNNGSLLPAATWSEFHKYEVLSAIPTNVVMSSTTISWIGTADSFEIEILEAGSSDVVFSEVVDGNSFSIADVELDKDKTYYARVRAKNSFFYSDWAVSGAASGIWNSQTDGFSIRTTDNSIIINSEVPQNINVFAIDGRLVRSVQLTEGENVIDNVSKGFYLVENQKVIVR